MSNWTIPQHCLQIQPFKEVLWIVNDYSGVTITEEIKNDILGKLEECWLYKPRNNWKYWTWTAWHKIDEPHFYWWLYVSSWKLHISNYWILLLDNRDNTKKRAEIFCSMLFSVQFPNLAKAKMDPNIKLYPFRILFQYLIDYKKIDIVTFSQFFYRLKTMKNESEYKKLVDEIKEFSNKNKEEKIKYIYYNIEDFIKNYVSCKYCFTLLNNFWILKIKENMNSERWKLKSPKRKSPTHIKNIYVELNSDIEEYIKIMLNKYTMYDEIKTWNLKSELSRKISNFIAPESLYNIKESSLSSSLSKRINIPEMLITTATNSERWSEFEEVITDAFNVFSDIKAERIWWPSEPDVLCEYNEYCEYYWNHKHMFTADAKSTNKKLNGINSWRLISHKEKYWWEFSLVITPHWVPSAEIDIHWTPICLLSSYALSDIIKIWIMKQFKKEDFSFNEIYDVIINNLWCDISDEIYKLIDKLSWVNQSILA